MCGRTACTLAPDDIQKACCYRDPTSKKYRKPEWKDCPNAGREYIPSYNMAPTSITPVLINESAEDGCERVVQPMMWGIIPPWHKGDWKSHGLSTNNCRIENLETSKLYRIPFIKGQRCAVVCDGFYEWQTTKSKGQKQPYFIYAPQKDGIKIEDNCSWESTFDEDTGWAGGQLLKMAAIYSIWTSPEGEEIFSYSIITMESNDTLSWLHHRMPAILDTEESLANWLDYGHVNSSQSLPCLKPTKLLSWHPVSNLVNNSRNKDTSCNKPVELESEKPKKPTMLQNWLKNAGKKIVLKEENESAKRKAEPEEEKSEKKTKQAYDK